MLSRTRREGLDLRRCYSALDRDPGLAASYRPGSHFFYMDESGVSGEGALWGGGFFTFFSRGSVRRVAPGGRGRLFMKTA